MVAKVILWCIWNHCIADSMGLLNIPALNFLRKPSKNIRKYNFFIYFFKKRLRLKKHWVYIIKWHRGRSEKQCRSSKNTAYWSLKHLGYGTPYLKLNLKTSLLQMSLKLHLLPRNVFDYYYILLASTSVKKCTLIYSLLSSRWRGMHFKNLYINKCQIVCV